MQGIQYNVDIVLCIDATGSMTGIIDKVKMGALKFKDDLTRSMEEKGKSIHRLRVKVIPYRDYYCDGDKSMSESAFFVLPGEASEFASFVNGIKADGGGDEPENGLEAIALAMNSAWEKGDKFRQIVVVWTDASAHPLEKNAGSKPSNYPTDIPKNFDELTDLWEEQGGPMNASAKRLIIYSPDAYPWTDISTHWENTIHYASKAGEGMAEVDYESIIDAVANSV